MKTIIMFLLLLSPIFGLAQSDDPSTTQGSYLEITRDAKQYFLAPGTNGQILSTNGTTLNWKSQVSSDVTVTDAGGYFTGTDQEAVNQEVGSKLQNISALSHNVTTGTTDVNGDITILHGLGATPTTVIITGGTNDDRTYQVLEASKTSTQFTVRVYDAGSVLVSSSVTFKWIAIE